MPRGYPDDNIQSSPMGQTIADNAELGARLGAVTTVQRSGQVVYSTNFINGAGDWTLGATNNAHIRVKGNAGILSNCSIEFLADFPSAGTSYAFKYIATLDVNKFGLECYIDFARLLALADEQIQFELQVSWDGILYEYTWFFEPNSGRIGIVYVNSGGFPTNYYITLPYKFFANTSGYLWHYFKIVVDPQHNRYVRLYFDDHAYDLSIFSPVTDPFTISPYLFLYVIYNPVVNCAPIYLGSAVFTINEP